MRNAAAGRSLEGVTRPLLDIMQQWTGLESTYLTLVDLEQERQEILYARNTGSITIPEGLEVEWQNTLCKRALNEGRQSVSDVPSVWGDNEAAKALGLQTYVSVPVLLPDGSLFGTLCGASGSRAPFDDSLLGIMDLFARVIADQADRERSLIIERARSSRAEIRLHDHAMFFARAEHQLKTPLTIVLGWAEMLSGEHDPDAALMKQAIGMIAEHARRLRAQVDSILEAARTEILAADLDIQPLDAQTEIASTVRAFAGISASHTVKLDWSCEPARLLGDRMALYQILGHLIENAIKYMPEGGHITISGEATPVAVMVHVDDTGPGIPEGIDVFEAFAQGAAQGGAQGVGDRVGSIGLGLHIVRQLAEAMDGTASVTVIPSGARFTITLPRA